MSTVPSHEQALQQIVALKKEVSELRGQLANVEEDYHKNETELHSEVCCCSEQTDRQADRQTGRQADRQAGR